MKKILLVLAFAAAFTSCTNDENNSEKSSLQTTTVSLIALPGAEPVITGRNVNRGNIYVWVKDISFSAKSVELGSTVSDLFTLTGNYSPSATPGNFSLSNVPLGNTLFNASTSSYDANKVYNLGVTDGNVWTAIFPTATSLSVINTLKAKNPFVEYKSPELAQAVTNTNAGNSVTMPMHTLQGRMISAFYMEQYNSNFDESFKATISVTTDGQTSSPTPVTISDGKIATFEWSNSSSLKDKEVTYTIKVEPKLANSAVVPTIYTIKEKVEASVSKNCIYMIPKDKAPVVHRDIDNITFVFDKWKDGNCSNCQ